MKWVVYSMVLLLAVLHQDFWNWDNATLVLGFLPAGLAYHMLFSLLASIVWALAVKFAWPSHIEVWADESDNVASKTT